MQRIGIFHKIFLVGVLASTLSAAVAADNQAELNLQALGAARSGNIKNLETAFASGASINTRNRLGESLLMAAIKNDQMPVVKLLLDRGCEIDLPNAAKVTPLMASAFYGRPEMARLLLDKKANVNAVDQLSKTAMVYAAGTGQTPIVEMLVAAGVPVNARYPNALTALMWAGAYGHLATTQKLLDLGADAALLDNRGKTVAQMADENGHTDVVSLLKSRR